MARSSRPLLRRTEPKYFYGSKTRLGGWENLRKKELGKWEKGSVWSGYGRNEKGFFTSPRFVSFQRTP